MPSIFTSRAKPAHGSGSSVASAMHQNEAHVANASLSHRSSHQRMVTRSPNHMWASSCRMTVARRVRCSIVGTERKMSSRSPNVMAPKFSIAPG